MLWCANNPEITDYLRNNQLSNLPIIFQVVFDYMKHAMESIGI